jgi:calcineurin-like phosphoesterase family protein
MENKIIENWNNIVTNQDTVYILGDFSWEKEDGWFRVLNKLNGMKVLIKGNHDLKNFSSSLKRKFLDIKDYKEISDNGRKVIMCHYPMPFYRSNYNFNIYHLYGHLHVTLEEDLMQDIKKLINEKDNRGNSKNNMHFVNVGCMMPWMNYTPRTLDEIIKSQGW